jgi:hypothetical protein
MNWSDNEAHSINGFLGFAALNHFLFLLPGMLETIISSVKLGKA